MDAFEQVVAEILWMSGHWVRTSVKIELTREDKIRIKKPSSPRWELDIVAYNGRSNVLRVIECKSYLDSVGVQAQGFDSGSKNATRYKLFNDPVLRDTVLRRTANQFFEKGFCRKNPKTKLGLACGKIKSSSRTAIETRFKKRNWDLLDEHWLKHNLELMASRGYENQTSAVVAKLLLRSPT